MLLLLIINEKIELRSSSACNYHYLYFLVFIILNFFFFRKAYLSDYILSDVIFLWGPTESYPNIILDVLKLIISNELFEV